jgi:hypothetical protein
MVNIINIYFFYIQYILFKTQKQKIVKTQNSKLRKKIFKTLYLIV